MKRLLPLLLSVLGTSSLCANAFTPLQLHTPLKLVHSETSTSLYATAGNNAVESALFRSTVVPPPQQRRRRPGTEKLMARCLAMALAMTTTTTTVLESNRAHAATAMNAAAPTTVRPIVRVKRKLAPTTLTKQAALMETTTNSNNNVVRVMTGTGVVLGAAGAGLYVGDSVRKQQKQLDEEEDYDDELPERTMLANFSSKESIKKMEYEEEQIAQEQPVAQVVVEQEIVEQKAAATNEATRQFFQRVLLEQQQKIEKARQEKIASVMNNGAKIAKTIGFTTRIVDQKPPPVIITNDNDEPAPVGVMTGEAEQPAFSSYTDVSVQEVMVHEEPMASTIPVALPMGTVPISMPPVEHDVLSAPIVELPKVAERVEVAVATTPAAQQRRLPLMTAKYIKARKQPKPPKEEMKLAEKYAAIASLEERAFQILVDLGMVEVNETSESNN